MLVKRENGRTVGRGLGLAGSCGMANGDGKEQAARKEVDARY